MLAFSGLVSGILLIGASGVPAASPEPLSGTWDVTFHIRDMTTPATFSFTVAGETLTGTAYSDHTGPGKIREGGAFRANALTFTLDFRAHESIDVTGTLENGKLSGEFRTEGMVGHWDATKRGPEERGAHAHP
jgi:hypothetical protein